MNVRFIKTPEKRRIEADLETQFGITKLPYLLLETGKEKIRGFSGSLSKEEIAKLARIANIELIGLYALKKEQDFRLTIDTTHLLKDQITKNIVELNDEQLDRWLRGFDIETKTQTGTVIIKHGSDFIGSGKSNGDKIFNYVPKDRRLKSKIVYGDNTQAL